MYIKLRFSVHDKTVYIPDGYVNNLKQLQNDFLNWVHDNPDCIEKIGNHYGYVFNEDDFLNYVNSFIITGNEKAFFSDDTISKNLKVKTLNF